MRQAFSQALARRHACKRFDPARKISDEGVNFILDAGRLSPSSFGMEHWKFVVVRDGALKRALQAASFDQPQLGSCSIAVVILAKLAELAPESDYVRERLAIEARGGDWQSLLESYREAYKAMDVENWSVANCHLAAANMMTAASVIGVDSCPIGGFDSDGVRRALGVDPARYTIAMLLALGYCGHAPPPKQRLALSDLVDYR